MRLKGVLFYVTRSLFSGFGFSDGSDRPTYSSTHPLTSFGFSAEEIKALNRLTVEQGENAGFRELLAAFAEETLDTTCSNALTDSNRSLFPSFYGLDPDANTKAKITGISNNGSASAICTYGGQTVASARCATLNYEY
ncbi:hypothetical protein [Leptospira noguchii]|uniref:hypothetical protein n=1 Tax=Leptospira noguchii TaxID=28182 RepID=UPI0003285132|nr:hypothetical protein [Leptospira noguchii]EMS86289.1 hypothetical protein LEP1GSC074_0579 [Leptospira noguchii str. Hook]